MMDPEQTDCLAQEETSNAMAEGAEELPMAGLLADLLREWETTDEQIAVEEPAKSEEPATSPEFSLTMLASRLELDDASTEPLAYARDSETTSEPQTSGSGLSELPVEAEADAPQAAIEPAIKETAEVPSYLETDEEPAAYFTPDIVFEANPWTFQPAVDWPEAVGESTEEAEVRSQEPEWLQPEQDAPPEAREEKKLEPATTEVLETPAAPQPVLTAVERLALATGLAPEASRHLREGERHVLFRLEVNQFAVPLEHVLEADRVPKVTPVPAAPEFVRGVFNLRGDVLPLLDLRLLLGMEPFDRPQEARMLVVKVKGAAAPVALAVDQLHGLATFPRKDAGEAADLVEDRLQDLLVGSGEHRGERVPVLDIEKVFASVEILDLAA